MLRIQIRFGKAGRLALLSPLLLLILTSVFTAPALRETVSGTVNIISIAYCIVLIFVPRWEMRKIDRILDDRCDAAAYLSKIEPLVLLAEKKPNYESLQGLLYRKALALSYLGRLQEAKQIYETLRTFPIQSASLAMFLNGSMVINSLAEENLPAAQMYQQGEINCTAIMGERERQKIPVNAYIQISQANILNYQKNYAQAKALFTEAEAVISTYEQCLCSKVGLSFAIGRTDYNMGNYAEAAPRLQFVADNGGTLLYRTRAKEMLAQIEQANTK